MEEGQYVELLKSVSRSVKAAELAEGWADVAFKELLRSELLRDGGGRIGGKEPKLIERTKFAAEGGETTKVGALAQRLGVAEERLGDLVSFHADSVELHMPSSEISTVKKLATRQLALIVAAVRLGSAIDEEWVDVSHVREALENYGRLDQANFASYLKATSPALALSGRGKNLRLRLTRPGWEEAAALLAGEKGGAA